jgi:hypothetical protein
VEIGRRRIADPMSRRLHLDAAMRGNGMAYFPRKMNSIERGCKVLADVLVALLLLVFAIVFFGSLGGLTAFILLEAALLSVDYLVPDDDVSAGAVKVRRPRRRARREPSRAVSVRRSKAFHPYIEGVIHLRKLGSAVMSAFGSQSRHLISPAERRLTRSALLGLDTVKMCN